MSFSTLLVAEVTMLFTKTPHEDNNSDEEDGEDDYGDDDDDGKARA